MTMTMQHNGVTPKWNRTLKQILSVTCDLMAVCLVQEVASLNNPKRIATDVYATEFSKSPNEKM